VDTCNRFEYPEEDTVYVLVAERASLIKRIDVIDGVWESKPSTPSKNYTYEAYHVPDLNTFKELIKSIAANPHKCIVNGRPSRSWKEGDTNPRNAKTLKHKKTKYMMLDIDDMKLDGWVHTMTASQAYRLIHDRLTELNNGFDVDKPGAVIHMTSSWGKPNAAGPRLRIVYELDRVVTTEQLQSFFTEFKRRYKSEGVDPSLYKRAQIVYTANPRFNPPIANPIKPGRGRVMYNKNNEVLDWDRLSYTYDASYKDLVELKAAPTTTAQDRQFTLVCDKLAEEGLIRSVNHDKVNITCPWVDEHSSGEGHESSTTIWLKEDGTSGPIFYCQHQTCQDEHRMWPQAVQKWIQDEVISEKMIHDVAFEGAVEDFEVAEPRIPKDVWPSIKLPPVTNKANHEFNMMDVKNVFIHDKMNDLFVDRRTCESIRPQVLSRHISRVENPFPDAAMTGVYKKVVLTGPEAWEYTDVPNNVKPGTHVGGMTWIPMESKRDCIINDGNSLLYNEFRGLVTPPRNGDSSLFVDHVRMLYPEDEAFEWMMGFFAHMVQKPWEKPTVAALHTTPRKGMGRGMLLKILTRMLGQQATTQSIKKIIEDQNFNDFLYKKLLVGIEEVKVSKRYADDAGENLKTFITDDDMMVNAKYKAMSQTVPRFDRVLLFSNNLDAIKIDRDDRRVFVYQPPEDTKPQPPEYYNKLGHALNDPAFISAVMDRLMTWRIAVFKPFEAPPMTSIKAEMARSTEDAIFKVADDAMARYAPEKIGIPKDRVRDIIEVYMHAEHIFLHDELDRRLTAILSAWEHKRLRKVYKTGLYPQVLYCRDLKALVTADVIGATDINKRLVQEFETYIDELILNTK